MVRNFTYLDPLMFPRPIPTIPDNVPPGLDFMKETSQWAVLPGLLLRNLSYVKAISLLPTECGYNKGGSMVLSYLHAPLQKQDRSFAQLCSALRAISNKKPEINRAGKMGFRKNSVMFVCFSGKNQCYFLHYQKSVSCYNWTYLKLESKRASL